MGKQGKQTPAAIQQFIIRSKTNAPELTYVQIKDKAEAKFGRNAAIDKSTVGRILARAGIAGMRWDQRFQGVIEPETKEILMLEVGRLLETARRTDPFVSLIPNLGMDTKLR